MPSPQSLTCKNCQHKFIPCQNNQKRFCSNKCRNHFWNHRPKVRTIKKECEYCKKAFFTYGKRGRFCSRNCAARSTHPLHPRTKRICVVCGKTFLVAEAIAKRKVRRPTCSMACRKKMGHRVGCDECGKLFHKCPGHIGRQRNVFCSRKCLQKFRKKTYIGPDRFTDKHGYITLKIPGYLGADHGRYIKEHRYVMENRLRRSLLPNELVHHKNGIRHDNADENLDLRLTNHHPRGQSVEDDLIPYWIKMLKIYKPDALKEATK